jgi:hypothetical protein
LPVDEVNLEDPVTGLPSAVGSAHRLVRARRDVQLDVVAGDFLVRELTDQMSGDRATELPSSLLR